MSTHSPGPWYFDESDYAIRCERYGVRLATLEGAALLIDGRLMAASPDLLEACEVLLSELYCGECAAQAQLPVACGFPRCTTCEKVQQAEAAIKKARGEQ